MNKSGLKKFATNIRIELLSLVKTKVDYFLKLDISNLPIEFKSYESSIKEIKNRCTSDEKLDKSTYVILMGVEQATSYAQSLFDDGRAALTRELNSHELNGNKENDALMALIEWLWARKK